MSQMCALSSAVTNRHKHLGGDPQLAAASAVQFYTPWAAKPSAQRTP